MTSYGSGLYLDLDWPKEQWSEAVREAGKRGVFRHMIRSQPYPSFTETAWTVLILAAREQGDG